jgi:carbon storage regulator
MLVLTCKVDESVWIDGVKIRVVVTEVRGDKVRIGFDVPRDISILRDKVLQGFQHGGDEGSEAGVSGDDQECGGHRTA